MKRRLAGRATRPGEKTAAREEEADLHAEDAGDPDGTADALQAQGRHLGVVAVLQPHAERRQQGGPRQLRTHADYGMAYIVRHVRVSCVALTPGRTLNMGLT